MLKINVHGNPASLPTVDLVRADSNENYLELTVILNHRISVPQATHSAHTEGRIYTNEYSAMRCMHKSGYADGAFKTFFNALWTISAFYPLG
jgi:hypothetical protein